MHALYNYRRQIKQHSAIMMYVETTTHQSSITVVYAIHLRWVSFIAYEDYYSIMQLMCTECEESRTGNSNYGNLTCLFLESTSEGLGECQRKRSVSCLTLNNQFTHSIYRRISQRTVWMRAAILLRKALTNVGLLGMAAILYERVSGKLK